MENYILEIDKLNTQTLLLCLKGYRDCIQRGQSLVTLTRDTKLRAEKIEKLRYERLEFLDNLISQIESHFTKESKETI